MGGERDRTGFGKLDLILLILLAAAKFLVHFAVNAAGAYGFFRDEFYYIACSERLAFGYVDHPPLSILLLKISRLVLGDSLTAIRVLPAAAGALTVFLTGLIAKELGGGRFARLFAALCVILAPLHLGLNSYFSMNSFDILIWTLAAYLIILWIQGRNPVWWMWLGVVLGMGLQNKISVLWLGFGLAAGLLLTENRRFILTRGPWLAAGIAGLIFLPYILWQVPNGWPTLRFMAGATGSKMLEVSFLQYVGTQVVEMNPVLLPVWFSGLVWYLFAREGRPYRMLGLIYLSVLALLVLSGNARSFYLAAAYPMLFASGALVLERVSAGPLTLYKRGALLGITLAGGIAIAPMALPVMPVEKYISYSKALGVAPKTEERIDVGALPQFFADMHGWEEIVASVAEVYRSLDVDDQDKWAVFVPNYGVAGAIDFLGRQYNLPAAISGHNNYWLWGPGDPPPENLIILGGRLDEYDECCQVYQAGTTDCTYCMPYEDNVPIFVCRNLRVDPLKVWPGLRNFQ